MRPSPAPDIAPPIGGLVLGKRRWKTPPPFFDEMLGPDNGARPPYEAYHRWFEGEDRRDLIRKSGEAERFFRRTGITFNVYGAADADERLIPFDIVPRIISGREWARLTRGIEQRVRAINAFLHDIYHRQEIIRTGRIPIELIAKNDAFLKAMIGLEPPGGVYTHIVGIDLVRVAEDQFYVLEDNARTPSGVSYLLENRETMLQMFPELFGRIKVRGVGDYPLALRRSLGASMPRHASGDGAVAVLTPGIHNSAYFEHAFLADHMGVELVEGSDDTPFFQIGETKYGRPILVRAFDPEMSFEDAVKLLMVSFDSTIKANLSVNLPLDLHVYTADSLKHGTMTRIEKDDPYFNVISMGWGDALKHAFNSLPSYSFTT